MPTQQTRKGCYKWGTTGKEYCDKNAKQRADKQGRAIQSQQRKEKKR